MISERSLSKPNSRALPTKKTAGSYSRFMSEIAAHGGWENLKQVEHYTKSVRRQKLLEKCGEFMPNRAEKK